ncbi:MAG: YbaN family protein [Clostridia bacterium]|nr:YbaN family protein [Clostridia bacterium]
MRIKKAVLCGAGLLSLGLGTLGTFLPVLPSVPFLLLAASCFGASSDRLYRAFVSGKLYQNGLKSYLRGQGMTGKNKVGVLLCLTATMGLGFVLLPPSSVGRWILGGVWLFHVLYFSFGVKTLK